jgi:hypothetical protein
LFYLLLSESSSRSRDIRSTIKVLTYSPAESLLPLLLHLLLKVALQAVVKITEIACHAAQVVAGDRRKVVSCTGGTTARVHMRLLLLVRRRRKTSVDITGLLRSSCKRTLLLLLLMLLMLQLMVSRKAVKARLYGRRWRRDAAVLVLEAVSDDVGERGGRRRKSVLLRR